MPLEGCPPQPGAPAVAGRLLERSKGKDTTTGHWELMGIVTPTAMPTYPHGFPHDVIDPFMHKTGRGVLGNKPASGTDIIQELGEEHQKTGKWIVYTSGRLRLPDRRPRGHDPARGALRGLQDRARDPDRQACGRARDRPSLHRRAGELRAHAEPPRLLARAAAAELPLARPRRRPQGARRRQDQRHLRRAATSTSRSPTKSNVDGINKTVELLQQLDERLRLRQPRRDRHALGPPQRPRQLPPLPAGLRPAARGHPRGAPAGRPADHHVRPRLRPDDAVDRPLAGARAPARVRGGPNAQGVSARGGVRRRRRDRERLARRQGSGPRHPRHADPRSRESPGTTRSSSSGSTPARNGSKRNQTTATDRNAVGPDARDVAVDGGPRGDARSASSTSAAGRASSPSGSSDELGVTVVAVDSLRRGWSSLHASPRSRRPPRRRAVADRSTTSVRLRRGRVDALPRARTSTAGSRARARPAAGRTARRGHERAAIICRSSGSSAARITAALVRRRRTARRCSRATSHASSAATSSGRRSFPDASAVREFVGSYERGVPLADRVPASRAAVRRPLDARRVFVADEAVTSARRS